MSTRRIETINNEIDRVSTQLRTTSERLRELADRLDRLQSERRTIEQQPRVSGSNTSDRRQDLVRETRYEVNDWVQVTNNYRGLHGTIGQIVELSGAFVNIRGEIGPGAGITFRKGVQNIVRVDPPVLHVDRELPTLRSATAQ